MSIRRKIAKAVVETVVANSKLKDSVLICAMKAEQEGRKLLALQLRELADEAEK